MANPNTQLQPQYSSHMKSLIADLTLLDGDLMSRVFHNNIPAAELLLKTILDRNDMKVISVKGRYRAKSNLHLRRNLVLNIHAKDSAGRHYAIEIHCGDKHADVQRARFISSMLDARILKSVQNYRHLKDSYVIFITENDIFEQNLPIYQLERMIRETQTYIDDGSHIVYVNGSYSGDDPIGKLMQDFRAKKSSDIYYEELQDSVKYFKETEQGVKKMCDAIKRYGDERAARAASKATAKTAFECEQRRIHSLKYIVKNLMASADYTSEQAMNAMKLNARDRALIMQSLG